MQARRGTALLLSCLLGLLLLSAVHGAVHTKHAARGVALVASTGVEAPPSWRAAAHDGVPADNDRPVATSVRVGVAATGDRLASSDVRAPKVRGPPGSALV
jgi:hypothetical protein